MSEKTKKRSIIVCVIWIAATLIGSFVIRGHAKTETLAGTLRDAVLHETNKVSFFGMTVNPSVLSGFIVVVLILIGALLIRIFIIPRFSYKPGKAQILVELLVSFFDNQAKTKNPKLNRFLGAYMLTAGSYIFWGTLSELLGIQLLTTEGHSISMGAPLSDVNAAICLGVLSYIIIMVSGIVGNGAKGIGYTLKEYSLPISMSFRLFGALLSGLLVTELVYYVLFLSYVVPVIVGIMFTCIHAVMQTYILCMLISMYSAEVSERRPKKIKKKKNKNIQVPSGAEG